MLNPLLRRLRSIPSLWGWRLLISIARKASHAGIVVCDVTSTQSKYATAFQRDSGKALARLRTHSQESFQIVHETVDQIVRAEIKTTVQYYSSAKLLLMRVDYVDVDADNSSKIVNHLLELIEGLPP